MPGGTYTSRTMRVSNPVRALGTVRISLSSLVRGPAVSPSCPGCLHDPSCLFSWSEVSKRLGFDSHETSRQATPPEYIGMLIPDPLPRSAKGNSAEEMRVLTIHTGNRVLSGPGNHHPEDGYWSQSPLENRDFKTRLEILEPQSIHCPTGLTDIQ